MSQNLDLLAVSVGNSRTRIGAFVAGQLAESVTYINARRDDLVDAAESAFSPLREREHSVLLLASTNPAVSDPLAEALASRLHRKACFVERDLPIPIGRQLDREALVGEDRLLNAAAAYDVLTQACIVVDAGTAITVDLVDGAGTFHGGAIAPGAQLMMDSLTERAALLPEVEFAKPQEVIGHNTMQAMNTGVFHAMRGMVRELVERYAEVIGAFPTVVATGGDANLLFREFELIDRIVPDLTLMGLAVTLRKALEEEGRRFGLA